MSKESHNDIFTIGIGGAAGDGVFETGSNLGILLSNLGYEVYMSTHYPSLIRGGHNFVRLSFGREKIWNDYSKLDVLISLNEETTKLHLEELNDGANVLADSFELSVLEKLGERAVSLPMYDSARKLYAPPITRNSVALGAVCYLINLSLVATKKVLNEVFKNKKPDLNIKLAEAGFDSLQEKQIKHWKKIESKNGENKFLDGNTTFGQGLESAGLDFYVAYPMTPSSGILHYLAGQQKNSNLKVIQAENEISVINMALGISYAGKRVAVGSATGGFALMQEAFSFAGIAEIPLLVAVSQRQAPATGVPTRSSQSDLRFSLSSGHGEFPRIVIAPGDQEECFLFGWQALNLAWKFQLPVIFLMDKILSEHMMTTHLDKNSSHEDKGWQSQGGENYCRYSITSNGISPIAFPGMENTVVKVTSYEHNEKGITTEDKDEVKKMFEKRFSKMDGIFDDMKGRETIKLYGDLNSEDVVVCWGSTKGAVLEASKYLDKKVKILQVIWLEPLDAEKIRKELENKRKIICVEANHNGQLASLIREKTGINITEKILKYDSLPFDSIVLAEELNKRL